MQSQYFLSIIQKSSTSAPVYRIRPERDVRLIGQRLYRCALALLLRQAGPDQFPHDAICTLAPRPRKRGPVKLVIDRSHHIAEPKRQTCLLAAITRINVQFFRMWGLADEFLKVGIFGGEKQLHLGRPIGTELLINCPAKRLIISISPSLRATPTWRRIFCRTFLPVRTDSTIRTRVRLSLGSCCPKNVVP